jgi:bifunctional non-homologous end joining protein LigD
VANRPSASFVVQKHWATRLHYDFRLELDGTMKSWAVPKGPSSTRTTSAWRCTSRTIPSPTTDFEGTIPARQYGAGKVIIWDKGTWRPIGDPHKGLARRQAQVRAARAQAARQVDTGAHERRGKGEKQEPWLLIKERDEEARPRPSSAWSTRLPDSVRSLADRPVPNGRHQPPPAKKRIVRGGGPPAPPRQRCRRSFARSLATLVAAPPAAAEDWIYEIKFDGYRMLARVDADGDVRLITRNGHDWSAACPPGEGARAHEAPPGWLDGEIVVHRANPAGPTSRRCRTPSRAPATQAHRLLPVRPALLRRPRPARRAAGRRRSCCARCSPSRRQRMRLSEAFDAAPRRCWRRRASWGSKASSASARRAATLAPLDDWIKLKCKLRQEFVIGGWTDPKGARIGIGSLLLGVHDDQGRLRMQATSAPASTTVLARGHVGAPAEDRDRPAPLQEQDRGRTQRALGQAHAGGEVTFGVDAPTGIRHSVFQALRDRQAGAGDRREPAPRTGGQAGGGQQPSRRTLLPTLRITNPERVIDAKSGVTKIELVRFYAWSRR